MKLSTILAAIKPLLTKNNALFVLALASAFGFVQPELATKLRNAVAMLPAGSGDLVH